MKTLYLEFYIRLEWKVLCKYLKCQGGLDRSWESETNWEMNAVEGLICVRLTSKWVNLTRISNHLGLTFKCWFLDRKSLKGLLIVQFMSGKHDLCKLSVWKLQILSRLSPKFERNELIPDSSDLVFPSIRRVIFPRKEVAWFYYRSLQKDRR